MLSQEGWDEAQFPHHKDLQSLSESPHSGPGTMGQLAMPEAQTHRLVAYVTDLSLSHKVFWVPQVSEFSVYTGPSLAVTCSAVILRVRQAAQTHWSAPQTQDVMNPGWGEGNLQMILLG